MKKIVVSGIQPTGFLHIGNYLGAIKQWKELQKNPDYECRFGIMDLHAMTTMRHIDGDEINLTGKALVSCGIDRRNIFIQSDKIEQIFSYFWDLACNTSIGQLNRMTQFKEKSDKGNENLGLFSYPVLMAADILALEADLVPVGEDQKQHLELARDLAKKLGLKVPEPLISESCGRIMSLTDPTKKMSKSDPNDNSRINLSDDAETIRKKIKKAATTEEGKLNLEKIFVGCGGAQDEILTWSNAVQIKEIIAEKIIKELCK
jgi:tryptophanyl-tRNA synthetase